MAAIAAADSRQMEGEMDGGRGVITSGCWVTFSLRVRGSVGSRPTSPWLKEDEQQEVEEEEKSEEVCLWLLDEYF